MAKVSSRQLSWQVEFDALLSSTLGTARHSTTPAESSALAKLYELLSLDLINPSTQRPRLYGTVLEQPCSRRLTEQQKCCSSINCPGKNSIIFHCFERALQIEYNLKVAMVAHEGIRPGLEAIKAKKEKLANLDHSIAELHRQRLVIASKLEKDFESNKPQLVEYTVGAKRI